MLSRVGVVSVSTRCEKRPLRVEIGLKLRTEIGPKPVRPVIHLLPFGASNLRRPPLRSGVGFVESRYEHH
jgi:hypothetical protein